MRNPKAMQAEALLELVGKAEFEKRGDSAVLFAPEELTLANIEAPADAAVVEERRNLADAIKEHVSAKRKERPILFSGPMVRAILSGRKTQTRRVCKMGNAECGVRNEGPIVVQQPATGPAVCVAKDVPTLKCPYGARGDRLWVRETHFESRKWRHAPLFAAAPDFIYRADYEYREELSSVIGCHQWKPSIFMKREASRITLEIVSVRVERLQEISEGDAVAEGIERDAAEFKNYNVKDKGFPWLGGVGAAVLSYKTLWESINGAGSWEANPWVWVVEFKRI